MTDLRELLGLPMGMPPRLRPTSPLLPSAGMSIGDDGWIEAEPPQQTMPAMPSLGPGLTGPTLQDRLAMLQSVLQPSTARSGGRGQRAIKSGALALAASMAAPSTGNRVRDFAGGVLRGMTAAEQGEMQDLAMAQQRYQLLLKAMESAAKQQNDQIKLQSDLATNQARTQRAQTLAREAELKGQREERTAAAGRKPKIVTTPQGDIVMVGQDGATEVLHQPTPRETGKAADIKALLGLGDRLADDETTQALLGIFGVRQPATPDPKTQIWQGLQKAKPGTPEYDELIGKARTFTAATTVPRQPTRATAGAAAEARRSAVEDLYLRLNPNNLPPKQFMQELQSGRIKWPVATSVRRADLEGYVAKRANNLKTINDTTGLPASTTATIDAILGSLK